MRKLKCVTCQRLSEADKKKLYSSALYKHLKEYHGFTPDDAYHAVYCVMRPIHDSYFREKLRDLYQPKARLTFPKVVREPSLQQ